MEKLKIIYLMDQEYTPEIKKYQWEYSIMDSYKDRVQYLRMIDWYIKVIFPKVNFKAMDYIIKRINSYIKEDFTKVRRMVKEYILQIISLTMMDNLNRTNSTVKENQ